MGAHLPRGMESLFHTLPAVFFRLSGASEISYRGVKQMKPIFLALLSGFRSVHEEVENTYLESGRSGIMQGQIFMAVQDHWHSLFPDWTWATWGLGISWLTNGIEAANIRSTITSLAIRRTVSDQVKLERWKTPCMHMKSMVGNKRWVHESYYDDLTLFNRSCSCSIFVSYTSSLLSASQISIKLWQVAAFPAQCALTMQHSCMFQYDRFWACNTDTVLDALLSGEKHSRSSTKRSDWSGFGNSTWPKGLIALVFTSITWFRKIWSFWSTLSKHIYWFFVIFSDVPGILSVNVWGCALDIPPGLISAYLGIHPTSACASCAHISKPILTSGRPCGNLRIA